MDGACCFSDDCVAAEKGKIPRLGSCYRKLTQGTEDCGEIGGSRVHFPLHMGETPSRSTDLLRNKANSQQHPSIYEDRRPKTIEDTEKKQMVRGLLQDKKVPGTSVGTRATAAPVLCLLGLLQDSWERARLMAPFPAKQGLSSTERDLVA